MNRKSFIFSLSLLIYLASLSVSEGQLSTDQLPAGVIKRFTHGVSVYTVAFSPDGQLLASGGNNNEAILWNTTNRNEEKVFRGHTKSVMSVVFSQDGKYLATASHDGFVRLWDVSARRKHTDFKHTGWAQAVAFSPDGKLLVSGGAFSPNKDERVVSDVDNRKGSLVLWSVLKNPRISRMDGHTGIVEAVAFSPDGRLIASASRDKTVKLWDVANQQLRKNLTKHKDVVYAVAFSPDGRTLATSSRDYTIKLWSVASGENFATFEISKDRYIYAEALAFSPDGKYLALACLDYTIRLYDVDTLSEADTLRGHNGAVTAVAFSPDGKLLASGSRDRTVLLYKLSHFSIEAPQPPVTAHPELFDSPVPPQDTTPPNIAILSPKAHQVPSTLEHLTVQGKVSDDSSIAKVTVNGREVQVSVEGRFTATVELDNSENVIHLTAKDVHGNMEAQRLTIVRPMLTDLDPPTILHEVPPATEDAELNLQGKVADKSRVGEVTINNRAVSVSENGAFTETVPLAVGENEIRVTATDSHGNMETQRSTITRILPYIDERGPDIRIHEPTTRGIQPLTIDAEQVTIAGTVTDPSGVSEVKVKGKAVLMIGAAFNTNVSLTHGNNSIRVSATDTLGNLSHKSIHIFRRNEDDRIGKDFALLFAVEDYDYWEKLRKPIYDAVSIKEDLENLYNFQTEFIQNPTREDIFRAIRAYAERDYADDDQLFIFFAGHGYFDDTFEVGYLVARDTQKPEEDKELLSYVTHSVIRDIVDRINCKHVFLVLDTCYSGTFDRLIAMRGQPEDGSKPLTKSDIQRKLEYTTRKYLTSGGKEQVPDDSAFVQAFLEALRSKGGLDNILTVDEIASYMENVKPKPRASGFGSDEPGSDFLFFAR